MTDKTEAAARRKAMSELRNARKAFKNAKYQIRKAEDDLAFATTRLLNAAKAAGESP
jgi:hypothetical protein